MLDMSGRKARVCWILALAIALALLFFGTYLRIRSRQMWDDVDRAARADSIHLQVDLSQVGVHKGTYERASAPEHSQFLLLRTKPSFASPSQLKNALAGLNCRFVVTGPKGQTLYDKVLTAGDADVY